MGQKLLYIGFVGIFTVSSNSLVHSLPETYKFKQDLTARKVFAKLFSKSGKLLYIGFVGVFTVSSDFVVHSLPGTYKFKQDLTARKVFCLLFSKKVSAYFFPKK